jgi:hypothetical protein
MLVPLCAVFALAGCGAPTEAIESTAALDGYVTASGAVLAGEAGMSAGDSSGNNSARMFVSFPLDAIPAGSEIQGAVLELRQIEVRGTPYADLGPLLVDHMDFGARLDAGDYGAAALSAAFAEVSSDVALEPRTLDVKREVEADLTARRARSQFRLRFDVATDNDGKPDFARYTTHESAPDRPVLRVTYKR